MKGSVTLKFNQATMIEALQTYLDAQFKERHVVTAVKAVSGSAYSDAGCFEIEVSDRDTT